MLKKYITLIYVIYTCTSRRDAEQAESRRWLAGQGEPEPGTGVAIFLVSIPDKRKSTFKRRIALDSKRSFPLTLFMHPY